MSVRASTSSPRTCSGAMNAGVPPIALSFVSAVWVARASSLTSPKSTTFTKSVRLPIRQMKILLGLISRWIRPAS
jgi:hypothetical protein